MLPDEHYRTFRPVSADPCTDCGTTEPGWRSVNRQCSKCATVEARTKTSDIKVPMQLSRRAGRKKKKVTDPNLSESSSATHA